MSPQVNQKLDREKQGYYHVFSSLISTMKFQTEAELSIFLVVK